MSKQSQIIKKLKELFYKETPSDYVKKAMSLADELETEKEQIEKTCDDLLLSLNHEIKRYEQTLEFYADENNYEITGEKYYTGHGNFTEDTWVEIAEDGGERARQVLKKN